MGVLFGIGAALSFGLGDFLGALAAKRVPSLIVSFLNQLAAVPVILLVLLFLPMTVWSWADLASGAIAGVFTTTGMVLLYRALSEGSMGVLGAIVGTLSAIVPFIYAMVIGETLSPLGYAGIVLALVSVFVVSKGPEDAAALLAHRKLVLIAAASGISFGFGWVFVVQVASESGAAPLLVQRVVGVAIVALLVTRARAWKHSDRTAVGLSLAAGVSTIASTVMILISAFNNQVAVPSVLQAMAPLILAVLANRFLGQTLNRLQKSGMVMAVAATAMLAIG